MRSTPGTVNFSTLPLGQCTSIASTVVAGTKSKVRPRIVGRQIASAADDIFALLHPVCGEIDGRANSVARALWAADKFQLKPVTLVRVHVAQKHRMVVHHVDDRVQLAVIEQIAHRHAASCNHHCEARALNRRHIFKFLAELVVEQHRPLLPTCSPCVFVGLRVDVPVRHEQIFPPVVVVVQEGVAPTEKGNRNLAKPHVVADVGEIGIAFIVIERLVVV